MTMITVHTLIKKRTLNSINYAVQKQMSRLRKTKWQCKVSTIIALSLLKKKLFIQIGTQEKFVFKPYIFRRLTI